MKHINTVCECTEDPMNVKADNTYVRTTVFKGVHDLPCFYSFNVLDMCVAILSQELHMWCYNPNFLKLCMYVRRFQNVVLRCPTPRLHCFLSSNWPSFRFLSFMAFLIPSIQFFFGLPRALFCFGIHFKCMGSYKTEMNHLGTSKTI